MSKELIYLEKKYTINLGIMFWYIVINNGGL